MLHELNINVIVTIIYALWRGGPDRVGLFLNMLCYSIANMSMCIWCEISIFWTGCKMTMNSSVLFLIESYNIYDINTSSDVKIVLPSISSIFS